MLDLIKYVIQHPAEGYIAEEPLYHGMLRYTKELAKARLFDTFTKAENVKHSDARLADAKILPVRVGSPRYEGEQATRDEPSAVFIKTSTMPASSFGFGESSANESTFSGGGGSSGGGGASGDWGDDGGGGGGGGGDGGGGDAD